MGQIKNIKLHIVTDIKLRPTNYQHHDGKKQICCECRFESKEECYQRKREDKSIKSPHIGALPSPQDIEVGAIGFVSSEVDAEGGRMDQFSVISHPLTTESAMKK